jgi:radical SAM superfamily enzyme YgiQ (UPF0313 family)
MRALLVSGLGPSTKNDFYLDGSLFDGDRALRLHSSGRNLRLSDLHTHRGNNVVRLLRPAVGNNMPHLTTLSITSILERTSVIYDVIDLRDCWRGKSPTAIGPYDVALLSTTFIWDRASLKKAINWIANHFPTAQIVLGGQYSNLKYRQILSEHKNVQFIILGDAEDALPKLLESFAGRRDIASVPNLVCRDASSKLHIAELGYIDLESVVAPSVAGYKRVIPYESMRGCPFSCKFCSFPAASPKWRYKSAEKIAMDWRKYKEQNNVSLISAMDSTFTVPPARMRDLYNILPSIQVEWEAFSRANSIADSQTVSALEAAGCRRLAIGFESMSDKTLNAMSKKVRVKHNIKALDLLSDSSISYKISFIAGYPGETAEDYQLTHDFLVNDFRGHFILSVFSIADETMPLWEDADRYELIVRDKRDPDYSWQHSGMEVDTATTLVTETLDTVRRRNPLATPKLWQGRYEDPMIPGLSNSMTLALEKAIERLAMTERDYPDPRDAEMAAHKTVASLANFGVCSNPECLAENEPRSGVGQGRRQHVHQP